MDLEVAVGLDCDDLADLLGGESPVAPPAEGFKFAPCSYILHREAGEPWRAFGAAHNFVISVRAERLPQHFGAGGTFRWHKNCVLPRLHISVDGTDEHGVLEGAAVILSAVTVDVLAHTARSVGLDGATLRPLVNRECTFTSLSFTTTSYNLPGRPSIYLMASLLLRAPGSDAVGAQQLTVGAPGALHAVVCSSISPALTVDARKRQSKLQKAEIGATGSASAAGTTGSGANSFAEGGGDSTALTAGDAGTPAAALLPFAPQLLERRLEKVGKEMARQHIDNSIDGLRAYLSALNIRNKCKHPLFLVLRFDACVGLLYDSASMASPVDDDASFFRMMECLVAADRSPPTATGAPSRFAPFVVAVKSTHSAATCEHSNCPVKLCTTLSLPHASSLPPSYTMLCDRQVQNLRRTYCRLHCSHHSTKPNGLGQCTGLGGLGSFGGSGFSGPLVSVHSVVGERPAGLAPPAERMSMCTTCNTPHALPLAPAPSVDPAVAAVQRHAAALLSALNELTLAATEDDLDPCPEREWEHGLSVLAQAMSMHCRTRSTAEIVGYMQDESASAAKRPNNRTPEFSFGLAATHSATNGANGVRSTTLAAWDADVYDHSHAVPTVMCDRECEDAVMDGFVHSHDHDAYAYAFEMAFAT